jgi:hypothetical protein
MVLLTIGSAFAAVMIWLALRANTRFSGERRETTNENIDRLKFDIVETNQIYRALAS